MRNKKILRIVLLLALIAVVVYVGRNMQREESAPLSAGETAPALTLLTDPPEPTPAAPAEEPLPAEDGTYYDVEDVAYYLHTYGHLPDNYITKAEAEDAGWVSYEGNLWDVAYGSSIGGDRYWNSGGQLPKGEKYYEADVNYEGGYRGSERIVYTDDGDVWYTSDHYDSFEKLY